MARTCYKKGSAQGEQKEWRQDHNAQEPLKQLPLPAKMTFSVETIIDMPNQLWPAQEEE